MVEKYKDCIHKKLLDRDRRRIQKVLQGGDYFNDVTIISNDCLPGFIYSLTGNKFLSPTINLSMSEKDLLVFLLNLKQFWLSSHFEQVRAQTTFPVADLCSGNIRIRIRFVHYRDYDEATEKFLLRMKRINFDRIVVLLLSYDLNKDFLDKVDQIPYKKIILANKNVEGRDDVFCLKCIKKGKKLFNRKWFFGKLYLEDFDILRFFRKYEQYK